MKKFVVLLLLLPALVAGAQRWSEQKAQQWYAQQPWLVGSDYIPADASNELEMWQAATFDPAQIDKELGWAQGLGMNTMRVFLHDLLWKQDPAGFEQRIDVFLAIAQKHHIWPIFVLFDSCWAPDPQLGPQPPPVPGVHNSRWVQSPGIAALKDPRQLPRLKAYVQGVVGAHAHDARVLAWDMWNEPDNDNDAAYKDAEDKNGIVLRLLPEVFGWARAEHPMQPLTSGLWRGDWSSAQGLGPMGVAQLKNSDVVSFHDYGPPDVFERHVKMLQQYHRPLFCTEYMARSNGSTFEGILPLAMKYRVAAINWGFVNGKTQTNLPWSSWAHPVSGQPEVWFHDIFHADGTPYSQREVDLIRTLTAQANGTGTRVLDGGSAGGSSAMLPAYPIAITAYRSVPVVSP